MDPRAAPWHRVHRAQFGRSPPAEGLIEVKNLSKIHGEDSIGGSNQWITGVVFGKHMGKTVNIYIYTTYIHIYIYVGYMEIWNQCGTYGKDEQHGEMCRYNRTNIEKYGFSLDVMGNSLGWVSSNGFCSRESKDQIVIGSVRQHYSVVKMYFFPWVLHARGSCTVKHQFSWVKPQSLDSIPDLSYT